MKIVVCVKLVPDTAAKVEVVDGQVTWGEAPLVINPWDEYAVETALKLTEEHGGDVIAVSVGDEKSKEAIKHALAMGCSEAVLINDAALDNADSQAVAKVLASAIQKIGDVDLAFFGKQAIDGDMGVTTNQTARVLGWPALTLVSLITAVSDGSIQVERTMEEGRQLVTGDMPAAVSVSKDIGEPRYPSFMGIRKASRVDIPVWTLADLDVDSPDSAVNWLKMENPPEVEITNEIIEGESPEEIAETLADKIMAEKVL